MGSSKKYQVDGDLIEGKIWVIAGITICAPLRSISMKKVNDEDDESSNSGSTTPTAKESRLPEKFPCPPPPRKLRPVSSCQNNGDIVYFTSPELDSLFEQFANAERAKSSS
ncbi:cyclin-dependent protein kinase inhibitor SMR6-like [Cynara cardunculus var. scolymus]|uniref:Cyclin-dependent kinase inhibitor n=1 Tax=Cynara cardunculus var. scolymus TaxID=59895 RepID=A0A118K5K4_CYNCS|nr:cyclin-dependent protein kinase inhibitor SMR6-like [Cynara cardunculus var. scolymus]KVI09195.1 hypothetical protein Ccrd_012448 [Cynara cardunculus var. scolymus]